MLKDLVFVRILRRTTCWTDNMLLIVHNRSQNACTVHLLEQLQRISAQQSKIRDLRNKLGAFREVAVKQGDAFAQLGFTKQLRAAYLQCLAECVRRWDPCH